MSSGGVQIMYGGVVCVEAELSGEVKIGAKTIVHPCAKILATKGPIIIGDHNIVEELVTIQNLSSEPLVIGNNNVFEVGSTLMAKAVGDHNIFETKCFVGRELMIGHGCTFGAATSVGSKEEGEEEPLQVPDNSVFYGEPLQHRVAGEKPAPQSLQIDFLAKILPNYHHIKLYTMKKQEGES